MRVLITGGAGFIGVNSAYYFVNKGNSVTILDNLSRIGSSKNLEWIQSKCNVSFFQGDVRQLIDLVDIFSHHGKFDLILHLAGQVAVTTSVTNPREDFEINAFGTFNLLEAARLYCPETTIIYSSTNKVYGEMKRIGVTLKNGRYAYKNLDQGVDENQNLDFHSPYGCSKGAADQYCQDYFRIFGLKTIVMRQSCIYGYRQFGIEDQGWMAWFSIASALGRPITIYGDGKQVRDVLFVDDLVRAYDLAYQKRKKIAGKVFNIGGGPTNTLSLHELIQNIEFISSKKIPLKYENWRPGDQKVFIGNISLAEREFGWKPNISPGAGIRKLYNWVSDNKDIFIMN